MNAALKAVVEVVVDWKVEVNDNPVIATLRK